MDLVKIVLWNSENRKNWIEIHFRVAKTLKKIHTYMYKKFHTIRTLKSVQSVHFLMKNLYVLEKSLYTQYKKNYFEKKKNIFVGHHFWHNLSKEHFWNIYSKR